MHSARKLKVSFDVPSDGWLGLDLRVGEQHLFENVSHIYPGLRDLCAGLCDVLNGTASRPIVLYLEPAELELLMAPASGDLWRFTATVFRGGSRPQAAPALVAELPAATIVLTFWRALLQLQTSLSAEEFAIQFCEPFPSLEMASLTELLEARKS